MVVGGARHDNDGPSSTVVKAVKLSSLFTIIPITTGTLTFSDIRSWASVLFFFFFSNFLIEIEKWKSLRFDKMVYIFYYC